MKELKEEIKELTKQLHTEAMDNKSVDGYLVAMDIIARIELILRSK